MKIGRSNLAALIEKLAASGRRVVAPKDQGSYTDFGEIQKLAEADLSRVTTRMSIKQFFFPITEPILTFAISGNETILEQTAASEPQPTVIFGSRPCDAASLPILDEVFAWDYEDQFYLRRRAVTTVISISCTDCDDSCFCTALGLAPNSTDGSDLLLTPIADGEYLAEPCSDKGTRLAAEHAELFHDGDADKQAACGAALDRLPKPMDLDAIKAWLDEHFDDDFWAEASFKCIGCGACTYVCPTCHCFDIVDEADGEHGVRRKNWDSCQFGQFTRHASGHNPRPDSASRWRQRLMHKFKYYPERFSMRLCVGCGRCIRACPVQMNITEQLKRIEDMSGADGNAR